MVWPIITLGSVFRREDKTSTRLPKADQADPLAFGYHVAGFDKGLRSRRATSRAIWVKPSFKPSLRSIQDMRAARFPRSPCRVGGNS